MSYGPLVIRRDEQSKQYELVVDGLVVSVVGYDEHDGRTTLLHTATQPEWRGRGHATSLVGQVLEDLRSRRSPYVASCPFVRAYIAGHPPATSPVAR